MPMSPKTDKQMMGLLKTAKPRRDYRISSHRRGYNKEWARKSKYQLSIEPLCRMCERPAKCTDHVITKAAGGTDDPSNLQSLCWSCHSAKTAKEDGGFGNAGTGINVNVAKSGRGGKIASI